jgi:hypothetical protein
MTGLLGVYCMRTQASDDISTLMNRQLGLLQQAMVQSTRAKGERSLSTAPRTSRTIDMYTSR